MERYKIGIFRDKKDIEIKITDDNIINITGMMGSGKSTLGKKLEKEKNMELISLDWLFGYSLGNRPEKIYRIIKKMEILYPETKNQDIFRYFNKRKKDKKVEQKYYEYTENLYKYLVENKSISSAIIEGRHIYKYTKLDCLKGTIIIKRTSLLKSYKRAFSRDVSRLWREYKEGKIEFNIVLDKFIQRIKIPITDYMTINKYIKDILTKTERNEIYEGKHN